MVGTFVEFGVADQGHDLRLETPPCAQAERGADGDRQAVAQRTARDLDAGNTLAVGMVSQPRSRIRPGRKLRLGQESLDGEHGVEGRRSVPFGQEETIPVRVADALRRDVQHAVVEHP